MALIKTFKNSSEICIELASQQFINVFLSEQFGFDFLTFENSVRYFSDIIETPNFLGFEIMLDGTATTAGYCFGVLSDYFANKYYEIKEIFLSPEFQHSGLGTTSLLEIEKILKSDFDVQVVSLNTSKKIPAYHFYMKNGYKLSSASVHLAKWIEK